MGGPDGQIEALMEGPDAAEPSGEVAPEGAAHFRLRYADEAEGFEAPDLEHGFVDDEGRQIAVRAVAHSPDGVTRSPSAVSISRSIDPRLTPT